MKVVFRVDASFDMGTGHVMRCLTLAHMLAERGAVCQFICRAHKGHLIEEISAQGFKVHILALESNSEAFMGSLTHEKWLGTSQKQDAQDCVSILKAFRPDWLIVDHYALDAKWEASLAFYYHKLMVIDDLADRCHQCDLLLDQTFARNANDYISYTPQNCILLCGSMYALLRPEFSILRDYSLMRRKNPSLKKILINMGGVDKDNITGLVMEALKSSGLPNDLSITVIMGNRAPWLRDIQELAQELPWVTEILVGVNNMAQIMAESDLAIGAAGSTSWERCCLGLPTISVILAENQEFIGFNLEKYGAIKKVDFSKKDLSNQLSYELKTFGEPLKLKQMAQRASTVTNGLGATIVGNILYAK